MKLRLGIVVILCSLILFSCGSGKEVVGDKTIANALPTKQLLASHQAAAPSFNTMASRVQVVYAEENKEQSITASLRIRRNDTIWVKASVLGITLAKALITPDKVQYYETLGNTYFDGDYRLLSEWVGTELNFEKTQALLLGQSIFSLTDRNYQSVVLNNRYQVTPKSQPKDFIHSLFLDPTSYKVISGTVQQPDQQRMLQIQYGPYEKIEERYYPSSITIFANQGTAQTKIALSYKKIDLEAPVRFPFRIPEGYQAIELN